MWRFPFDLAERGPKYIVDKEQILKAVRRLSGEYVPQWQFGTSNPDIGSVIAMIFAGQMEEAARAYAQMPFLCMEELFKMLGIMPGHPTPARTVLVLEVDGACEDGILIKKGSRFYGKTEKADFPIVFETKQELLAMPFTLTEVLGISSRQRKVVSFMGDGCGFPLRLFDFRGENLYRESIQVVHPLLNWGRIQFEYTPGVNDRAWVNDCSGVNDCARLYAPFGANDSSGAYGYAAKRASIQAFGYNLAPEFLHDGENELSVDNTAIFGEQITLYRECYIGQNEVFDKTGTRITCSFDLSWGLFDSGKKSVTKEKVRKLVMKRPQNTEQKEIPQVFPQEVSISYYNGKGFKTLSCGDGNYLLENPFEGEQSCRLKFVCPDDWQPMNVGGFESRCIRLRIQKAENCYLPKTISRYPILKNVRFSYIGRGFSPNAFLKRQGASIENLTEPLLRGEEPVIFSGFPYEGESFLFGFKKVPGTGETSLYLHMEAQTRSMEMKLMYEYSTENGFAPLHVTNGTGGGLKSGVLHFYLPRDAAVREIEGRSCFWIKLTDLQEGAQLHRHPLIYGVFPNGVEAQNLYVSEEKEGFTDEAAPGLEAAVSGNCIVDTEVRVNENSHLEQFVKWKEIPFFHEKSQAKKTDVCDEYTGDGRCYVLNRSEKVIRFGDGKNGRIPSNTEGAAWRIKTISCDGSLGNVAKNTITESARAYPFLNRVFNPAAAYGGGEGERDLSERGRDFLSMCGRYVSETDFIRGAKGFSKLIEDAALLRDREEIWRLILMLKEEGQSAAIYGELMEQLQKSFPGTESSRLIIEEPLFVKVSLNIWLHVDMGSFLKVKGHILGGLSSYFSPFRDGRNRWGIGRLPKQEELEQVLYRAAGEEQICYFQAVISYTDEQGIHETALEDIRQMPDAVCREGEHYVYRNR